MGWMRKLWGTWLKLPQRWRVRILFWSVTSIGVRASIRIWDVGVVIVGFLVIGVIAVILGNMGARRFYSWNSWAEGQVWTLIRGVITFALLPAALDNAVILYHERSVDSLIGLVVILFMMGIVWVKLTEAFFHRR